MPHDPNCPLCPTNGKVIIIAEAEVAYLVEAKVSPIEGCFLIVPKDHITELVVLPDLWQVSFGELLLQLPCYSPSLPLNISLNLGRAAGQTLPHLHYWVITRSEEEMRASYGKGMATLIKELDEAIIVVR